MILKFNEYIPVFYKEGATESELLGEHIKLDGASLISICSRPGMGKTALALNLALAFARKSEKCVYIFSYEMTAEQVYARLLSILSGVEINSIRKRIFSKEELELLNDSMEFIKRLNIIIDDEAYNGISDMEEKISRIDNLGMIVFDYLGVMFSLNCNLIPGNYKEIATIDMRNLSRKFSVPILFTHNLSKRLEYREDKRPNTSDVESYIAQNTDTMVLLYREDYYRDAMDNERTNLAEVTIVNKFGKTGTVYLNWYGECMKFKSCKGENDVQL